MDNLELDKKDMFEYISKITTGIMTDDEHQLIEYGYSRGMMFAYKNIKRDSLKGKILFSLCMVVGWSIGLVIGLSVF